MGIIRIEILNEVDGKVNKTYYASSLEFVSNKEFKGMLMDFFQETPNLFWVLSSKGILYYQIEKVGDGLTCTCPAFKFQGGHCKHTDRVKAVLNLAKDGYDLTVNIKPKAKNKASKSKREKIKQFIREKGNGLSIHEMTEVCGEEILIDLEKNGEIYKVGEHYQILN